MKFPLLFQNDIYAIPVGDIWNIPQDKLYFIYSPLSGHVLVANEEELVNIENICSGDNIGTDAQNNLLKQLKEQRNQNVYEIPDSHDGITEIDILMNFKCNFSCSYCYSAAGRSAKEVSFEHIKVLVDYLFSPERSQKRTYRINFSGGGEPLLSFPLIKKTVDYIKEKAKQSSCEYSHGLVTNGSLLTPEIIDFVKEQRINLVVSFEVLKEFQDLERGSYDSVARNMDLLLRKECPFGIRATITPISVHSMKTMVEELSVRFPKLKAIVFDTVLSADLFNTPQQLGDYYGNFSNEYWSAKELGAEIGIEVACNSVELASILRTRACRGKVVLTPNGDISSCARVSSPQEDLYDEFIYGKIDKDCLVMDNTKFSNIMEENNIYTRRECRECYARWSCGAGCWLFSKSFPKEFEEPFCNFTKDSLKKNLYEIISKRYSSVHKQSLWDYINGQIKYNHSNL
ncbi:radical SAM protein [Dysgonomonas sp. GY75]|uniref:radical SAM/SPASM domain-containing protein n=1 Tax=Dysgonomonas sp. GY75 TaxID=2780419 RepID=UPI0018833561|nr:radical SAM protein [Dysgonomonas sp. GY75]MBF0651489.1 radical SAM protein [Dysgonomonas sp. GY75]